MYPLITGMLLKPNIYCRPTPKLLLDESYKKKLEIFDGYLCHSNPKVQYLFPLKFKPLTYEDLYLHIQQRASSSNAENWIVINEAVSPSGGVRKGNFARHYGYLDWIQVVVRVAKRHCKGNLWISDTGLHYPARWITIRNLAEDLGIGVAYQVHWDLTEGAKGLVRHLSGIPILNYHLSQTKTLKALSEVTVWGENRKIIYDSIIETSAKHNCSWVGIWSPTIHEHWGVNTPCNYL